MYLYFEMDHNKTKLVFFSNFAKKKVCVNYIWLKNKDFFIKTLRKDKISASLSEIHKIKFQENILETICNIK